MVDKKQLSLESVDHLIMVMEQYQLVEDVEARASALEYLAVLQFMREFIEENML